MNPKQFDQLHSKPDRSRCAYIQILEERLPKNGRRKCKEKTRNVGTNMGKGRRKKGDKKKTKKSKRHDFAFSDRWKAILRLSRGKHRTGIDTIWSITFYIGPWNVLMRDLSCNHNELERGTTTTEKTWKYEDFSFDIFYSVNDDVEDRT